MPDLSSICQAEVPGEATIQGHCAGQAAASGSPRQVPPIAGPIGGPARAACRAPCKTEAPRSGPAAHREYTVSTTSCPDAASRMRSRCCRLCTSRTPPDCSAAGTPARSASCSACRCHWSSRWCLQAGWAKPTQRSSLHDASQARRACTYSQCTMIGAVYNGAGVRTLIACGE